MAERIFDAARIAEGYRKRPFLHPQVISIFTGKTDRKYENGLDVGCGAGLSSSALGQVCGHVTGIDSSSEMIRIAKQFCDDDGKYDFYACSAEELEMKERKYDIVTAAGAVQWIDMHRFLPALSSIVEKDAPLLVYDFCISDEMEGDQEQGSAYHRWWHEQFIRRFPRPWRDEHEWTGEETAAYGFELAERMPVRLTWRFDRQSFTEFMMIQSNVNAKIEEGKTDVHTTERWFEDSLCQVFEKDTFRDAVFTGYLWILKYMGRD